jgi:putative SOS response-associated peptidase YedK
MCGRYVSTAERADLLELYDATAAGPIAPPSYNVAPTQDVNVILERPAKNSGDSGADGEVERQLRAVRWGLVPSWAKEPKIGSRLINARMETLAEKPAFRRAFTQRRAIIPAAGYYEWQPEQIDGKVRKQPYYMHPASGDTLSLAGLYELWPDPDKNKDDPGRWLWTVTIITTDAIGEAGEIHDRTPLILPPDRIDDWLDPDLTDPGKVKKLLEKITVEPMEIRPVARDVNNVGNNRPDLLDPVPDTADTPLQLAPA